MTLRGTETDWQRRWAGADRWMVRRMDRWMDTQTHGHGWTAGWPHRYGQLDTWTDTDRQLEGHINTERWTQIDRKMDGDMDRDTRMDRRTDRLMDTWMDRKMDEQMERHIKMDRQAQGQIQTTQMDRHVHTDRWMHRHGDPQPPALSLHAAWVG